MASFEEYRKTFPTAKLSRQAGVLEVVFHSDGGPLIWAPPSWNTFASLFQAISEDDDNLVVILTGTGDAFTPERPPSSEKRVIDQAAWRASSHRGTRLQTTLLDIPVPVIAAVNGPAHIHPELALLSDIVIATPDTTFRDSPHLPNGMVPGDGMHVVMPYLIGRIRANYFLLTGQTIPADEAKALGLVNEIVSREQLMPRARELATSLAALPIANLRATRQILTHTVKGLMHDALGYGLAVEGLAATEIFKP